VLRERERNAVLGAVHAVLDRVPFEARLARHRMAILPYKYME
jgi:hypothetical protein